LNLIIATILQAETESDVSAVLDGKTRDELVGIANNLDIYVGSKKKGQIKEAIIAGTVRAKLRSRFIQNYRGY
jgi:hypothetical protein